MRPRLILGIALICALGACLRLPGLHWTLDFSPEPNWSLHPDENRSVQASMNDDYRRSSSYVQGMTSHITVLAFITKQILGRALDQVLISRLVSLILGVLSIATVAAIVLAAGGSSALALLSAMFFALAPLSIMTSHFGTPDAAATFYFLLALLFAVSDARRPSRKTYLAFAAAMGAALSIKFFISLAAPLALMVMTRERPLRRCIEAAAVLILVFLLFHLFRVSPIEFRHFLGRIAYDNVFIEQRTWPWQHPFLYAHMIPTALGIPTALLAVIGSWIYFRRIRATGWRRLAVSDPMFRVHFALLLHGAFALVIGVNAGRHLLPFLPFLCIAAADGFEQIRRRFRRPMTFVAVGAVLILYLAGNALAHGLQYRLDPRREAATWIAKAAQSGTTATAFMDYARVQGVGAVHGEDRELSVVRSDLFVTCDLEYERYMQGDDASRIFHARGGQARLLFFQEIFAGERNFEIAQEFFKAPLSMEQQLVEAGILGDLQTYIPGRYVIFRNLDGSEESGS